MSRSHKDAVGGHTNRFKPVEDFFVVSAQAIRFSKKFAVREARREQRRIVKEAIQDYLEEQAEWWHFFYEDEDGTNYDDHESCIMGMIEEDLSERESCGWDDWGDRYGDAYIEELM